MNWDNFLKSLETEGGKMFATICMILFFVGLGAGMIVTHHPLQETGRTELASAISAFLGILYGYLKAGGGGSKAS